MADKSEKSNYRSEEKEGMRENRERMADITEKSNYRAEEKGGIR